MFTNPFLHAVEKLYEWFISIFSNLQSVLLFLFRITWGHQFFLGGLKKLHNIDATLLFFDSLSIPLPHIAVYFVAICELIGGISLVLGLGSRFFALILSVILFVAYGTAHVHAFKDFHFVANPSLLVQEAPFPFLMTCLLVLAFGPGRVSLDGWIKRWIQQKKKYG